MAKLIELRNVYKIYGEGLESEVRALDGVSLDIEKGEFVAVVGQSGSGKSTMMNVLGCLDIPTRGTYRLDGVDVRELSDKELSRIRNKQIGFIFQQYNLIQNLTVLENVELPLLYAGVGAEERKERAVAALGRVGLADKPAWVSPTGRSISLPRCPAASSSVWPSPGPFPPIRPSSWRMSLPAHWIPGRATRCWASSSS